MSNGEFPPIELIRMGPDEVDEFARSITKRYADQASAAGLWPEERAQENARSVIDRMIRLTDGRGGRYLYWIVDQQTGERVGSIWAAITQPREPVEATMLYLRVHDAYRRRGYGSRAMLELETILAGDGVRRFVGTVYSHNRSMHRLMDEIGYDPVQTGYLKRL